MEEEIKKQETVEEGKKSLKDRFIQFCKENPDVIWTLVGGALSIIGGCVKLYANKSEYDNYLLTTDRDGTIYKLPAKQMKTVSSTPTSDN